MTIPDEVLKSSIRDVPGYPQPGVIFRDITPLLGEKDTFKKVIELMCSSWSSRRPDLVAAVEARGFIPGGAVALGLQAGFVPIRKPGKLPWKTISLDYQLEYGSGQLQVHEDAIKPGQTVLIVDDVLATGGTAAAAVELVRKLGGVVVGVQVLIELKGLGGRARLPDVEVISHVIY